jgi:hypothetical protein
MRDGIVNEPLDDIREGDEVFLRNVTFIGYPEPPWWFIEGELWVLYPLTVRVVDGLDPTTAEGLPDFEVLVNAVSSGAFVDATVTDGSGMASFELLAYHSHNGTIDYVGSYIVTVVTPDKRTSRKVRVEMEGPQEISVPFVLPVPRPQIIIDRPEFDAEYDLRSYDATAIEVDGKVHYTGESITSVRLHLFPDDGDPDAYPWVDLNRYGNILMGPGSIRACGYFYAPIPGSSAWRFNHTYLIIGGDLTYVRGTYILEVRVTTEYDDYIESVRFDIDIDAHLRVPTINVTTTIEGREFDGSIVVIEGNATDDLRVERIEVRIDGDRWQTLPGGTEWSYSLDTGALADREHVIEFRAYDGESFSEIAAFEFSVSKAPVNGPGGGNGGDDGKPSVMGWPLAIGLMASLGAAFLALILFNIRGRRRSE